MDKNIIDLSAKDRARLYALSQDHSSDDVKTILQKAAMYDEVHARLMTSHPKLTDEEGIEPDLFAIVKSLIVTMREADQLVTIQQQRIDMHHKMLAKCNEQIAERNEQLTRLVKVCEDNGIDHGLSKQQRSWMSKK